MKEYRPRLTKVELQFLVEILDITSESCREVIAMLEAEIDEKRFALSSKELEKHEKVLVAERRRKSAIEGLARRFRGLVGGGKPRRDAVSDFATFATLRSKE
jgi:hypothetical protein